MLDLIRWYVVVQLMGIAALPFAARFFRNLPDRGYAFARPLGMLGVAVILWFGAIFGLWSNGGATVFLIVAGIALAGWLGLRRAVADVYALVRNQRSHVYLIEGLFLVAFLFWAFCRSFFPDIAATEKPMEFAFLNGILRSSHFPPVDPWLSGNSISYYYLGYVMVAALTELSGVLPAVAFNLAIATLFALTVTGAFSLTHAQAVGLRRLRGFEAGEAVGRKNWPAWLAGGVGAVFAILLGNWEGFLELLYAHGFGTASFWQSVAIIGLNHPYLSTHWYPNDQQDNWWWFRASRVITDYPPGAPLPQSYNTINEFPFFSFLLGDLHPHVLALPFAFVCMGFALSFLRSTEEFSLQEWRTHLVEWGFVAFLFGAMFLLNAWDILTYLFVLMCAFAVRRYLSRPHFDFVWLKQSVIFGIAALIVSVALYWPFYLTFRSQANGLLGIVKVHSHLQHFLIFWGPFLIVAASLVIAELVFGRSLLPARIWQTTGPRWTRTPLTWGAVLIVALAGLAINAPVLTVMVPLLVAALALVLRYLVGSVAVSQVLVDEQVGQLVVPPDGTGGGAPIGRQEPLPAEVAGGATSASWPTEHIFALVLLFTAALLLCGTELVYIQDSFGNRMNTVFKLYYQSWAMLSVVGAYAVYYIGSSAFGRREIASAVSSRRVPTWVARLWIPVVAIFVAAAFVYVPAALESRSNGFTNSPTLDGLAYYARYNPDDFAGIQWLQEHVSGTPTIVEATGGSYSAFDEVSWMTGLPTILGWDFHEIQWRGASIVGLEAERKNDINTIYTTLSPTITKELLAKYHATYVYVGPLERQAYPRDGAGLDKFGQFMNVVYRNPGVTIYKVRGEN